MSLTFGLIAEGKTDQIVLRNILIGYFNDIDLIIRELQPSFDVTEAAQMSEFGGWYNVFHYCKSDFLLGAFEQNDFVVIHLDTDRSYEKNFDVPKIPTENIQSFVARVKEKITKVIQSNVEEYIYIQIVPRIIFAIAVDEIECWLLPLYYDDKIQSSTNNCLYKLSQKLPTHNIILKKERRVYERISKDLMKQKKLFQAYPKNPSFELFVEDLSQKTTPQ